MTLPIAPSEAQLSAEQRAAQQVTAGLRAQLQAATRAITALYVKLAGSLDKELPGHLRGPFSRGAADIIGRVHIDIRDELWALVQAALEAGQQSALAASLLSTIGEDDTNQALLAVQDTERYLALAGWIQQLSGTAQERAQATLLAAQSLARINQPAKWSDVMAVLGRANQAVTLLERDTRWATNAAYNQGYEHVTDERGQPRMWVGERDACLHCLAYTGRIAEAHRPYPSGLTFYIDPRGNPKPLNTGLVWGPPLHPNCRCGQEVVNLPPPIGGPPPPGMKMVGGAATPMESSGYPVYDWERGEVTPAMALRREARRSVLRGWSGSDSTPARLRAASALLSIGSGLPKSVEARARAAVKARRFKE